MQLAVTPPRATPRKEVPSQRRQQGNSGSGTSAKRREHRLYPSFRWVPAERRGLRILFHGRNGKSREWEILPTTRLRQGKSRISLSLLFVGSGTIAIRP